MSPSGDSRSSGAAGDRAAERSRAVAISGDYRGIDEVMEYVRRRRDLVAGTFQVTVRDVLANDEHGLVISTGRAIRDGTALEWRAHGLYRFRDGRIAECWVLPENQYEFDRIWA